LAASPCAIRRLIKIDHPAFSFDEWKELIRRFSPQIFVPHDTAELA
jgi:hypothetical protein